MHSTLTRGHFATHSELLNSQYLGYVHTITDSLCAATKIISDWASVHT